jgi:LysM repeat protein
MPASRFHIPPRWRRLGALLLALAAVMAARPYGAAGAPANQAAYDLIDEVNSLRVSNGLAPYNIDPILMAVAQAHTDYQVSIGSTTHYGADGSHPRDRAIAAGYGGGATVFVSENIAGGTGLTPAEAVGWWQGDAAHLNTMLGPNYTDVGAGAGESDGVWRYTLDAGYVAGGSYVAPTSAPGGSVATPAAPGFILSTPAADGSIVHVVQAGQTLWTIAAYYGVDVDTLRQLNNLPASPLLRIGQEIIVQPAMTQTPSPEPTRATTPTPTRAATATRKARTATPRSSPSPSPTPTPATAPLSTTSWVLIGAGGGLMAIGIVAAILRRDDAGEG